VIVVRWLSEEEVEILILACLSSFSFITGFSKRGKERVDWPIRGRG
jgi:hypothetical protein